MNLSPISLAILACTATLLSIAMLLAWRYFGRHRYALLWALAAVGIALQWVIRAGAKSGDQDAPWVLLVSGMIVSASATLVVLGSRDRNGLPLRLPLFLMGLVSAIIAIATVLTVYPNVALRGFIANTYCAIMMIIAAAALFPKNRMITAPEITMVVALMLFGLLQFALALLALGMGADGKGPGLDVYRTVVVVGLPAGYAGLGLSVMLLLGADLNGQIRTLIARDPLTGILNRRGILQSANAAFASARRHRRKLAAIICNLDRFKAYNQLHGCSAGDRLLVAFADMVAANVREEDLCSRIDGNVFLVVLVDSAPGDAMDVVARIRRDLAVLTFAGGGAHGLTASFGVTGCRKDDLDVTTVARRADEAMQRVRKGGGNGVATL